MTSNTPSPRDRTFAPRHPTGLPELCKKFWDRLKKPELPDNPTEAQMEAQKARIDKYMCSVGFDKYMRLVGLFATIDQQECYGGAQEWHRAHQLVRSLIHVLDGGESAVKQLVAQCSKYRWNRFERLFTRRYHQSLPGSVSYTDRDGVKTATFQLAERDVLQKRLCFSCLVDVDRVPPRLMVDLGIIAWGESPRMFAEYVLALIKKPIHLLRLKLIFDAAEKIGEGERFQVVRKPSSDLIEYYRSKLQKCTRPELAELAEQLEIPEEALGKVLVISEEVSGTSTRSRQQLTKFMPVPLKVAVFDGLYAAKRSISHALAGYALERELLASAAASIDQIADKLENDWKTKTDADVKSCLQRELQGVAETYAPKFEGASNIFKIEIYDSLCNIIKSSAESQGSINPRACANMLRAISRRLNARANEAIGKESFRAEDGGAIDLLIKAWEGTFEVLEGELQKKINFFNNNYSLFNDHSNCSRIRQHLITSLDSLHKMTARPFLSFASAIIETDQELQSAINELNHGQVRRLLAKMDVIIRLQRVQRGFEQLIADTSNRKGLSEEQLQKSIDTLLTSLPAQTSLVKPIYRELYPRYESLAEHVRKVVIELRSHRVDPRNLQERQAHIQAIRELATEHFDLEQELKLVVAKSSEESAKTDR